MIKSLSHGFQAFWLQLSSNRLNSKQLSSRGLGRHVWIYRALAFNLLLIVAICAPLFYSN